MKTRIFIIFCLFSLIPFYTFSQADTSFKLIRTFQGDIADAALDNLDDLYIISSFGQIKKYTPSGDSLFYDQVKKFGRLYTLDVSNPLKLLLFYKDYSTIVVLDSYLSTITSLDLPKYAIIQPSAIGLSYDNNIWIFDEYDNKLKKMDLQGNILLETADFRNIFNEPLSPQRIINDNGFVYLADTANGIFVFDNYGSFIKKIRVKNWQSLAVTRNYVISTNGDTISFYNSATFFQIDKKVPFFKPYLHSFTSANKLVTYSVNTLNVYQHHY